MSPSPKTPEEKKLPDDENSSNEELSHPPFHIQNEHIASTDESAANSEDENPPVDHQYQNFNGYCLLPQESGVTKPETQDESEDEDEEFRRFVTLRVESTLDEQKIPQSATAPSHPIESIWSTKLESEPFPVDDEKANYIKTRMSQIQLPESSIPIWAQICSEADWQDKLRERITCRQTTFFLNETN